uniref:Uncharacterized protein n=1 Tax=viral metagenome TaxID=1070528 RepID=A0A6C0IBH3_9ZZZZ
MTTPRINFVNTLIFIIGGLFITWIIFGEAAFSLKYKRILIVSVFIFIFGGAITINLFNGLSLIMNTCKTKYEDPKYRHPRGNSKGLRCNDWNIISYT